MKGVYYEKAHDFLDSYFVYCCLTCASPFMAADNSVSSKIDQDMEAMRNAFFNVKAITVHSVDNGIITYAYKLTDDVTDT